VKEEKEKERKIDLISYKTRSNKNNKYYFFNLLYNKQ